MSRIFSTLLIITSFALFGFIQDSSPTKSKLKSLFRQSILQDSKDLLSTVSNPWETDNTNGQYFTADTIKMVNVKKRPHDYRYCETMNWTFYKSDWLFLVETQTCKEPSSQKVSKDEFRFKTKIKNSPSGLILETYKANELMEKFLVVSIIETEQYDEVTLYRLKK